MSYPRFIVGPMRWECSSSDALKADLVHWRVSYDLTIVLDGLLPTLTFPC